MHHGAGSRSGHPPANASTSPRSMTRSSSTLAAVTPAACGPPHWGRRNLIPFQPRSVDLWTASQIGALVAEARHVNERLRALAILSVADPQGSDNADAAALSTIENIEALPFVIVRRKAFPNAFSSGLSVLERCAAGPMVTTSAQPDPTRDEAPHGQVSGRSALPFGRRPFIS